MLSDQAIPQRPPRAGVPVPVSSDNGDISHPGHPGLPQPLVPQRPPPPPPTAKIVNKDEAHGDLISLADEDPSEERHHVNASPPSPGVPNRPTIAPTRKAPDRPPTSYDKTTVNKEPLVLRQNLSQSSEKGKTKKRPEITVVGARPMSEVGFRGVQNVPPSPTVTAPESSPMTKSSESSSYSQRPDKPGIRPSSVNANLRPAIGPLPPKRPTSGVQVLPSKPSVKKHDPDSAPLIDFDASPLIPSSTSHDSFMRQDDSSSDAFRKLHNSNKPFSVQSEQNNGVGRINVSQSFNAFQELNDSNRPVPKPRPRTKAASSVIRSQENICNAEVVSQHSTHNNLYKTEGGDNSESIDYRSDLSRDRNNSATKDSGDKVPSSNTCDIILLNYDDDDDGSFKVQPRPSSQIGQRKGPTVIRPTSGVHRTSEKSDDASLNDANMVLKNEPSSSVLQRNPPPPLMKKPTVVPKPRNIALPTPPQKPSRIATEVLEKKNVSMEPEKLKRRSLELNDNGMKEGQAMEQSQGLVQSPINEESVSASAKKPTIIRPPRPQHSAFKKPNLASNAQQNDKKSLEPVSINNSDIASSEQDKDASDNEDDSAINRRPAQSSTVPSKPISDRVSIGVKVLPTPPKKAMQRQSHVEDQSNKDTDAEKESGSSDNMKSDGEVNYKDLREQLKSGTEETAPADVKDATTSKSFQFSIKSRRNEDKSKLFNFKMEPRSKSTDLDNLSTNQVEKSSWYSDIDNSDIVNSVKPLNPEKTPPKFIDSNLPIQSVRKSQDLISPYRDRDINDSPLLLDLEKSPSSNRAATSKPERPRNSPPTRPKRSPTSVKDSPLAAESSTPSSVDSSPKKPRILGRMASKKQEKPPVPRLSSASMKRPSLPSLAPDKPQRLPDGRGTVLHSAEPPVLPGRPTPGHPLYHYMVTGPRGVALFDYDSGMKGDLVFKEGDTISLVEKMDASWIRGRLGNKEGMFPHKFIEIIEPLPEDAVTMRGHATARTPDELLDTPPLKRQSNITSGPRCSARFDYGDDSPEDLIFTEGDTIRIIERVSDDWMKGEMDGRTGIFPLSFVEIVEDLPAEAAGSSHDWPVVDEPLADEIPDISKVDLKTTAHAIAVFDFLAPQPGDLRFEEADTILLTERMGDDWLRGYAHGKEGTFPRAFVNVIIDIEDDTGAADKAKTEHRQARAIYDFESSEDADLSFKKGQLISGVELVGDGTWSRGEIRGKRGMFPSNFVKLI